MDNWHKERQHYKDERESNYLPILLYIKHILLPWASIQGAGGHVPPPISPSHTHPHTFLPGGGHNIQYPPLISYNCKYLKLRMCF